MTPPFESLSPPLLRGVPLFGFTQVLVACCHRLGVLPTHSFLSFARLGEEGGQPLDVVVQADAHPVCLDGVFFELQLQGLTSLLRGGQCRVQAHPRLGEGFLALRERCLCFDQRVLAFLALRARSKTI